MRCSGDRGLNESDGLVLPLLEARQRYGSLSKRLERQ